MAQRENAASVGAVGIQVDTTGHPHGGELGASSSFVLVLPHLSFYLLHISLHRVSLSLPTIHHCLLHIDLHYFLLPPVLLAYCTLLYVSLWNIFNSSRYLPLREKERVDDEEVCETLMFTLKTDHDFSSLLTPTSQTSQTQLKIPGYSS